MTDKEKRFNSLCFAIFNSEQGKELMSLLDEMLTTAVAIPSLDSSHAYHREGQNDIIRRFKKAMNDHKQHKQRGENDGSNASTE